MRRLLPTRTSLPSGAPPLTTASAAQRAHRLPVRVALIARRLREQISEVAAATRAGKAGEGLAACSVRRVEHVRTVRRTDSPILERLGPGRATRGVAGRPVPLTIVIAA